MNHQNDFNTLGMKKREEDINALLDIPQSNAIPVPEKKLEDVPESEDEKKASDSSARKFCFHCGASVTKEMVFCPSCGQKLASSVTQPRQQFASASSASVASTAPVGEFTPSSPAPETVSTSAPSFPAQPKPFYHPPKSATPPQSFYAAPSFGAQAPSAPSAPQRVPCPGCGLAVPPSVSFCPRCGKDFRQLSQKPKSFSKSNKRLWIILGACLGALLIAGLVLFLILKPPAVEKVTFTKAEIVLYVGDTEKAGYSVLPREAGWERQATFTTSNDAVATVSENGTITARGKGSCTITVKCGSKRDTLVVVVKGGPNFSDLFDQHCQSSWAKVGADGSYLQIDTNPYDYEDYYSSAADKGIQNVNEAIGLPDSLYNDMMNTSYDMGKQTETFQDVGVVVTWTYHPDQGLEVTYKLID